jgi:hypothetical protein
MPGNLPADSALTSDYQPISRQIVRNRMRYTQRAWPETNAGLNESRAIAARSIGPAQRRQSAHPRPGRRMAQPPWRRRHGDPGHGTGVSSAASC